MATATAPTVYVESTLTFTASSDKDKKRKLGEITDAVQAKISRTKDTRGGGFQVAIVPKGSPGTFTIPLAGVTTIKWFLLIVDREVTVKLNGEATGHKLTPETGSKGRWELHTDSITAIVLENADAANDACLEYAIAGV